MGRLPHKATPAGQRCRFRELGPSSYKCRRPASRVLIFLFLLTFSRGEKAPYRVPFVAPHTICALDGDWLGQLAVRLSGCSGRSLSRPSVCWPRLRIITASLQPRAFCETVSARCKSVFDRRLETGRTHSAQIPPSARIRAPAQWSDLIVARVYACAVRQGGGLDGHETENQ